MYLCLCCQRCSLLSPSSFEGAHGNLVRLLERTRRRFHELNDQPAQKGLSLEQHMYVHSLAAGDGLFVHFWLFDIQNYFYFGYKSYVEVVSIFSRMYPVGHTLCCMPKGSPTVYTKLFSHHLCSMSAVETMCTTSLSFY